MLLTTLRTALFYTTHLQILLAELPLLQWLDLPLLACECPLIWSICLWTPSHLAEAKNALSLRGAGVAQIEFLARACTVLLDA